MRTLIGALAVALAFVVGCQKSEPGGTAGDDTFKIVVPATSPDVKQGEVQTVRVSIDRGAGFKQTVKLEMKAPSGLEVDPGSATVNPGDKADLQLKITAAKDAPLGDHKITVKGTPDKGQPAEVDFKVTVSAK